MGSSCIMVIGWKKKKKEKKKKRSQILVMAVCILFTPVSVEQTELSCLVRQPVKEKGI